MLADCTSASFPFSQVVRGRPPGLLQSLVVGATLGDDLAWNLNVPRGNRSGAVLIALMILETGGQPVVSLTEAL